MKHFNHYILGASLLAVSAGLGACSDIADDMPANDAVREVYMSVMLTKDAGDESRTAFNEADGSLACTWTSTDRIVLAATDGTKIGTLAIDPADAGKNTARFEGKIEVSGEKQTMNFIYLGNLTNAEAATSPVSYNYATQSGTLAGLADYDFFWQSAEVTLGASDAFATVAAMQRHIAFGHFALKFPADAAWTGGDVSVSGSGLVTNATLAFTGVPAFSGEAGKIATKATAEGDLYITVIPATTDLTFTATVGGKTYSGKLPARTWKANEYVRKNLGNGSFAGVEVAMTAEGGNDGELNEYGEPVNNPLAKWAKGNLYRVDGLTNGISESETENGALYQWGRNYGYMDDKGIYSDPYKLYIPQTDFINYAEAQGFMTYDLPNGISRADFYAYRDPSSYPAYNLSTGVSMHYNAQNGLFFNSPYTYDTVDEIVANPTKYFMDATPNGRLAGFGSRAEGMEWNDNKPDYWIESKFGDGGRNWAERAEKCGYENSDPCPEGWRLPTADEFKAIAPEGSGIDLSSGTLESALSGYAELREAAGIRYVIRWIYNTNYIQIESVVVDNNFTKDQINTLFWDQHVSDRVTRKFPYTGAIMPLIMLGDGTYHEGHFELVVRPFHRGIPGRDIGLLTVGYYDERYFIVDPEDTGNANAAFGGYWVSDKGMAFRFQAGEKMNSTTSYLQMDSAQPVMGYAIRPVRDSK